MSTTREEAEQVLHDVLEETGLEWEPGLSPHQYVVTLPGEKKLRTVAALTVGERALRCSAFVIRRPDENEVGCYRFLLRRNLRLPGLAYAIDDSGDVYVTGRLRLEAVDATGLDELFGAILQACDGPFDELLVRGFRTSMQKEWDWRVDRGESTRNLEAFRHLLDHRQQGDADAEPS